MRAGRLPTGGPDLGRLAVLAGAILVAGPVLGTLESGLVLGGSAGWTFQVPVAAFRALPSLAAAVFGWAIVAGPGSRPPRWVGLLAVGVGLVFAGMAAVLLVNLPKLLSQVLEPTYRALMSRGGIRAAVGLIFLAGMHLIIGWRVGVRSENQGLSQGARAG
ncbi:MAG: hypothetical protein AB7L66_09360 [Gemmatimonadales bacterium]